MPGAGRRICRQASRPRRERRPRPQSPDRRARAARIRPQRRLLLNTWRVQIDVDEFAREAAAGLSAIGSGRDEDGIKHLEAAMELNRGDFLVEERYDWAIIERERLLDLASRVLRALAAKEPASDTATHYRLMREFGERITLDLAELARDEQATGQH